MSSPDFVSPKIAINLILNIHVESIFFSCNIVQLFCKLDLVVVFPLGGRN